ncbi:CLUMA_CG021176, isoform A [Clunio marinus]|uniref:CLUMA_CG021176, isoform A n=1 Tax=Clunio marinus TaxID=568069 RepID=A0A1J1J6E8_9DIPT|nr:CLUMA_CG021176, isoform A [Clunio marinus]
MGVRSLAIRRHRDDQNLFRAQQSIELLVAGFVIYTYKQQLSRHILDSLSSCRYQKGVVRVYSSRSLLMCDE